MTEHTAAVLVMNMLELSDDLVVAEVEGSRITFVLSDDYGQPTRFTATVERSS